MYKYVYYKDGKIKSRIEYGEFIPEQLCNDKSKIMEIGDGDIYYADGIFKAWKLESDLKHSIENITKNLLLDKYGKHWRLAASYILGYTAASERFGFKFYQDEDKKTEIVDDNYNLSHFVYPLENYGAETPIDIIAKNYVHIDNIINILATLRMEEKNENYILF